mmetsp:Transcript_18469/g.40388  ORF Transcript_18469/g.40388 Transcript_18469/m.40388 type:complete len:212 (+) Transcript_18469:21-656(+)
MHGSRFRASRKPEALSADRLQAGKALPVRHQIVGVTWAAASSKLFLCTAPTSSACRACVGVSRINAEHPETLQGESSARRACLGDRSACHSASWERQRLAGSLALSSPLAAFSSSSSPPSSEQVAVASAASSAAGAETAVWATSDSASEASLTSASTCAAWSASASEAVASASSASSAPVPSMGAAAAPDAGPSASVGLPAAASSVSAAAW